MSDDVLITPGSRKIEFKDSSANVDAKIETDSSGNLIITNTGGDITIGDTTSDIFVGDGTANVDIVFEQAGEIRGTTGVTVTLGASDSNIRMATDLNLNSNNITNVNDLTITGNLNITGDINSYNVTDLDVTDKTITVGAGQTEANSGGSGLIVDGSGASLLWDEGDNYWAMNKSLAFDDTVTTTNQALGIKWTGFDKEGTTDFSDSASIVHTVNTGGHSGSVLLIQSQNDSGDGIAFVTNASSYLKHNSSNILTAANAFGQLGITSTAAELNKLDGYTGSVTELNYLDTLHATGVTSTEFDYLDGVTSNIQTQLNSKQASGSYLTSSSGLNASNLTSGTVPSARISHSTFDVGDTTAETGRTVKETGLYTYNVMNNNLGSGTDTSYYSVLTYGQGTGGSAQIATQWTSNGNKIYFRSLRDTTDNWWSWKEFYHTGHKPTYSELGTMAYSNLTGTPTIPTNNNQLTNGASYITSSDASITNKLPLAGGTMTGSINLNGSNLTGINYLQFENEELTTMSAAYQMVVDANDTDSNVPSHGDTAGSGPFGIYFTGDNGSATTTLGSGLVKVWHTGHFNKAHIDYFVGLYNTGVTTTEYDYLDGVTSNIQTQLNARTTVSTSGYNGTYNIPIHYNGVLYTTPTAGAVQITGSSGQITTPSHGNSSQWNSAYTLTNAITATATELNYTDGVTSNIQTQLNAKQASSTALTTSTTFGGDVSGTYNNIAVANNSHQHSQLYENGTITFGASYVQWTDQSGTGGTGLNGAAPRNPANGWYHNLIFNHANSGGYYSQIATGLNTSDIYFSRVQNGSAQAWQRIFADDYHPNADKWTTARTLSLTGAVTGSVSWDGSGNASMATTATADPTLTLSGDASGSATFTNLGNATLSVTVNDDSHFHHRLDSTDDRDMKPSTSGIAGSVQAIKPFFSSYGGMTGSANTTYVDVLAFDTYSDSSGGGPSAITFKKGNASGNPEMHIWKAGWAATTWGTGQRVFADNYHPNADKWTTARTITLGGDLSGSVSIDGSANVTLSAAVANNSHNHDASNINSGRLADARMPTTIGGSATTTFIGTLSGNANTASNTPVYTTGANSTHYVTFALTNGGGSSDGSGSQARLTDGGLTYNPSTNALGVSGAISAGSVDSNGDVMASGDFYGRAVNNAYSSIYRIGGVYFTWDSDTYGTQTHHSMQSTYGGTYGDDITLNSYHRIRLNIDSNNNNGTTTEAFEIGHNTTGTGNRLFQINGDALMTLGYDGKTPLFRMEYDNNHASGNRWDTQIEIGRSNEFLVQDGSYPLYEPANAGHYGMKFQGNSDAVFFGAEQYTSGHYRPVIAWGDDTTDSPFFIRYNWGTKFAFTYNGIFHADNDVIAYSTTTSDARFKDNVSTIENALDKVQKLRGVEFDWNATSRKGKHDIGFIAQEIEEVIPEVVTEQKMLVGDFEEKEEKAKTVAYGQVTALLVEAIKEQQETINKLIDRINDLEKGE